MVDFIKIRLLDSAAERVRKNAPLNWRGEFHSDSGLVNRLEQAKNQGLSFKYYNAASEFRPSLTVGGSLHKYSNMGHHNFNDFSCNQFHNTVEELASVFDFDPLEAKLVSMEIGVNVTHPYKTSKILSNCIRHKNKEFHSAAVMDEGRYKVATYQRHQIKAYDKRKHYQDKGYNIDNEILRLEKKWVKMRELNQRNISTLHDLHNYNFEGFVPDILAWWDDILFADWMALSTTDYSNYSNMNFWSNLSHGSRKYHRNKLKKLVSNHPDCVKATVRNEIEQKCRELIR